MIWVNLNMEAKPDTNKASSYENELVQSSNEFTHYPRDVNKYGLCIAAAVTAALVVVSWLAFVNLY